MTGCGIRTAFATGACITALALLGCGGAEGHFPPPHSGPIISDGSLPSGPLVEAPDGYLYGTTAQGGAFNQGTVFRIGFDGTETMLYSFAGAGADGADPSGGLIVGSDGDLYGTTRSGGIDACGGQQSSSGCGTVFQLTLAGSEQVLYFFRGSDDGGVPMAAVMQSSNGDLYGTTTIGGSYFAGTVFQLTPLGKQSVLYDLGSAGVTDGVTPQAALILGTDGALYGTTAFGGAFDKGTVFSVTFAGAETVLASFAGGSAGRAPTQALVQGSDGNFYGTSSGGGLMSPGCLSGCGTAFQVTPSGQLTVLYQFGSNTGDAVLPSSPLIQATDGNLYGTTRAGGSGSCNTGCGTVFKITPAGDEMVLYSFQGGDDGAVPEAALIQASDGALYGTTSAGGQLNQGTAFRLTLTGEETVLHFFGNKSAP